MAALPEEDRLKVWRSFMRNDQETKAWLKTHLKAAVDATDNFIDANQAAYNSALPVEFRTTASLQQKTLLFTWVARKRAGLPLEQED